MFWCRVRAVVAFKESIKAALTETQGLELVLGVGERCTVTSAIQQPGSGHLRGNNSGKTSIAFFGEKIPTQTDVIFLLPFFFSLPFRWLTV